VSANERYHVRCSCGYGAGPFSSRTAAAPMGDGVSTGLLGEINYLADHARGSLRRVLDEPNPFITIRGERS
jgi:hypothetical protein